VLPTPIQVGSTVPLTFEVVKPDGDAYDLTDHAVEFLIKRSLQDSDEAALWLGNLTLGIVFTYLAPDGVVTVSIPVSASSLIRYGRLYPWILRVTTPAGEVFEPETGTFLALNEGPL